MLFMTMYLDTRYDDCRCNILRGMTICSFFVNLRYGILFGENLNDVTMTSSPIWFLYNSNTNLQRAYLRDILNFIWIGHNRAEINSKEFNKE